MIAPTGRAILVACIGPPLSLLLAATISPAAWPIGVVWSLAALALVAIDGIVAPSPGRMNVAVRAPHSARVAAGAVETYVDFNYRGHGGPDKAQVQVETNELFGSTKTPSTVSLTSGAGSAAVFLMPLRRGEGRIEFAHCRWRGPLGMSWRQFAAPVKARIAITPDLGAVEKQANLLFSRTVTHGIKPLRDRGDGSEFDALTEFHPGMDLRLLEWKQSARHMRPLAKEVRVERNHQIVFAIDTGRTMCEPIASVARLDWSINAALVLAYVALRLGDKVSFFGFDARPRLATGFESGARAFARLQSQTAALDYAADETNYTLALTSLSERLQRRSMIIMFTEFTDTVSAELMTENIARLARKHLLVFVTFADEELETLRDAEPHSSDDVSRAVVADRLLTERRIVLERLRRMGVTIVESPVDQLGAALVQTYDALRRRERL